MSPLNTIVRKLIGCCSLPRSGWILGRGNWRGKGKEERGNGEKGKKGKGRGGKGIKGRGG